MYTLLFIFFIYSFLGWCAEVSYAALVQGKFVNRGFLNGPVCPIYGFGVVIVLACLEPLRESWLLLFLGSVFLTSLLELVTGFLLEKIFRQHWWDYSDEPFNLKGYICLRFSIMWGLACTFVIYILHPTVLLFIRLIPHTLGVVLLALSGAAMAVDLVATVRTIAKIKRRQSQVDELAAKIKKLSNNFGENLAGKVLDAAELKEELDERAEGWKAEMSQKREDFQESLDERRRALSRRRQKGQEELRVLWERLEALLDKPIFGQGRLIRAYPKMRASLRGRTWERLRRRTEK